MPSDPPPTAKEALAWIAIRDNARLAGEFVAGANAAAFEQDTRTLYAVVRCLEIISEASRRLRGVQQARFPALEWRQIEDVGNVYRHGYDRVLARRGLETVQEDLPRLVEAAESVVAALPGD